MYICNISADLSEVILASFLFKSLNFCLRILRKAQHETLRSEVSVGQGGSVELAVKVAKTFPIFGNCSYEYRWLRWRCCLDLAAHFLRNHERLLLCSHAREKSRIIRGSRFFSPETFWLEGECGAPDAT